MKDYKKILKGVINIIAATKKTDIGFANICTYIGENCPELKESEDERIRKELLEHCRNQAKPYIQTGNKCPQIQSWIAWLEKQGEQKPQKVLTWKHWENGIAGNGEGNDTFLIKWGPWHYSVSSCLGSECDYIELSELDGLLRKPKKSGKVETKEVTGTLKEMLDNIDPVELEETRKEMMESTPTDEEVQKLHDHLEMHKQLPKSEPQTIMFTDSGTMQVIEKLDEIIGKLSDIHQVLSKPFQFKTHGVEKVPPVTGKTLSEQL